MEDNDKQNGSRPQKMKKQPQVQLKKSTLIRCDIIIN
jgi:hypothetical protein